MRLGDRMAEFGRTVSLLRLFGRVIVWSRDRNIELL